MSPRVEWTKVLVAGLLIGCSGGRQNVSSAESASNEGGGSDGRRSVGADDRSASAPASALPGSPPLARRVDVRDRHHGVEVVDPYRWMETPSPELTSWLQAQQTHTRGVLDGIRGRDRLRDELRAANRAAPRVDVLEVSGRRSLVFAMRRSATDESAKLVVRDGWNGVERVLVDPNTRDHQGSHVVVDWASPSPDGRFVAYVESHGGGEEGEIRIIEVDSGRILPDRIDRANQPLISWRQDARSFFYMRLGKRTPGAPMADWYKGTAAYLHVIGARPDENRPVIGGGSDPGLNLEPNSLTWVKTTAGSPWAVAQATRGVSDDAFFVAPVAKIRPGSTRWRQVANFEDKVAAVLARGNRLYALTYAAAPNYRIVSFDARSETVANGRDVVAASEMVLQDFALARDALYFVGLDRGVHRLFRMQWKTMVREEVELPYSGSVRKLIAEPARDGLVFSMEGWTERLAWFQVDRGEVRVLPIETQPASDQAIIAEQLTASSRDGAEIPISVLRRRDMSFDGAAPAILSGYGAYGSTTTPTFNPFIVTWVKRRGVFAVCHVRGSGARGKSWHLDGIKDRKENGVDDFVACAEQLIRNGYTSARRLTATGVSAGGILVGGAITKRPELFSAAMLRVAVLNLVRIEFARGGPENTTEYGSVSVEREFRNLLASDPYHRLRERTDYPAVMVTVGLNDPRVPVWQPAKFAARLQALGRSRPVLLRVEADAGHGIGSTQSQREEEFADFYAFALWQSGLPLE
jgi:prolyl oligopeptidase